MDRGPCSNSESYVHGQTSDMVHNDWLVRLKGRDLERMATVYGCAKSTLTNVSASVKSFERWYKNYSLRSNLAERKIFEICPSELDTILVDFYNTIRKPNGEEYNPSSLRSLRTNLARYLKENFYPFSIVTSQKFSRSQFAFKNKMHVLEFGVRSMYLHPASALQRSDFEASCSSSGEAVSAHNYDSLHRDVINSNTSEGEISPFTHAGSTDFKPMSQKIQNIQTSLEDPTLSITTGEIPNLSCQNLPTKPENVFHQTIVNFVFSEERKIAQDGSGVVCGQMPNDVLANRQPKQNILRGEFTELDIVEQKPILSDITRDDITNFAVFHETPANLNGTVGENVFNVS